MAQLHEMKLPPLIVNGRPWPRWEEPAAFTLRVFMTEVQMAAWIHKIGVQVRVSFEGLDTTVPFRVVTCEYREEDSYIDLVLDIR